MTAKQLVRGYLQTVWAERDIDAVDRFLSPELAEHNPALPDGAEPLKGFLRQLFCELSR